MTKRHLVAAYKSGLEDAMAVICEREGLKVGYETKVLPYIIPESKHRYTPDWEVSPTAFIETKGIFDATDRKKAILIREQHPDITILYVFSRNQKLSKMSETTYGDWCDKHDLPWCVFSNKEVWLDFIRSRQ